MAFCRQCGSQVGAVVRFCENCGSVQGDNDAVETTPRSQEGGRLPDSPRGRRRLLVVGAAATVLVLLSLALFVIYPRLSSSAFEEAAVGVWDCTVDTTYHESGGTDREKWILSVNEATWSLVPKDGGSVPDNEATGTWVVRDSVLAIEVETASSAWALSDGTAELKLDADSLDSVDSMDSTLTWSWEGSDEAVHQIEVAHEDGKASVAMREDYRDREITCDRRA